MFQIILLTNFADQKLDTSITFPLLKSYNKNDKLIEIRKITRLNYNDKMWPYWLDPTFKVTQYNQTCLYTKESILFISHLMHPLRVVSQHSQQAMSLDALMHLPVNYWVKLQEAFLEDWPRGISGYTILETQRRWNEEGFDYGFKVFCPFGEVRIGMVAINKKGVFNEIVIQCPSEDTTKLEEALKSTKEINWNTDIIIPYAPNHVVECIKRVANALNVIVDLILPSESFILDKYTRLFEDISFPGSITFGLLTDSHIDLVDSKWPHKYPGSKWYFELLIRTKSGFGLFKDGNLISWVFINEAGTLGHMFTLEDYRRRGYAQLLLKIICNKLLSKGKDVFAFAVKGNKGACMLYKQVEFKNFNGVAWCYLKGKYSVK